MNKRQAKKLILRCVASIIRGHISQGADYLWADDNGEEWTAPEYNKLKEAVQELADELERRAQ